MLHNSQIRKIFTPMSHSQARVRCAPTLYWNLVFCFLADRFQNPVSKYTFGTFRIAVQRPSPPQTEHQNENRVRRREANLYIRPLKRTRLFSLVTAFHRAETALCCPGGQSRVTWRKLVCGLAGCSSPSNVRAQSRAFRLFLPVFQRA